MLITVIRELQRYFQRPIDVRGINTPSVELVFPFPEVVPNIRIGIRVHGRPIREVDYVDSRIRISDIVSLNQLRNDMGIDAGWTFTRNGEPALNLLGIANPTLPMDLDSIMNNRLSMATGFVRVEDSGEAELTAEGWDVIANIRRIAVDIRIVYMVRGVEEQNSIPGYLVDGVVYPNNLRQLFNRMYALVEARGAVFTVTPFDRPMDSNNDPGKIFEAVTFNLNDSSTISLNDIIYDNKLKLKLRGSIRRENLTSNSPFVEVFLQFHEYSNRFMYSFGRGNTPFNFRVLRIQPSHPNSRFYTMLKRESSFSITEQVEDINSIMERVQYATTELVINYFLDRIIKLPLNVSTSGLINALLTIKGFDRTTTGFSAWLRNLVAYRTHLNITFLVDCGWICYYIYVWDIKRGYWKPCYMISRASHLTTGITGGGWCPDELQPNYLPREMFISRRGDAFSHNFSNYDVVRGVVEDNFFLDLYTADSGNDSIFITRVASSNGESYLSVMDFDRHGTVGRIAPSFPAPPALSDRELGRYNLNNSSLSLPYLDASSFSVEDGTALALERFSDAPQLWPMN